MMPSSRSFRIPATLLVAVLMLATPARSTAAAEPDGEQQPPAAQQKRSIKVTVYPILVQAPIFGASINLPSLPSPPGGGGGGGGTGGGESGGQSGSTDASLNGAYLGGVIVEANRWFAEFEGTWADLSASHDAPRVSVDSKVRFGRARGGIRLFDGLSATVGVRYIKTDLDATLTLAGLNRTIEGRANPSLWDPLVGLDWRADLGSRWSVDANAQGGGFGVGTDVDLSGEVNANWHVTRHFDVRLGYTVFHYKYTIADVNIGSFQRTLISTQTLYGPIVGLGIVF
jgi:hypothetical protein